MLRPILSMSALAIAGAFVAIVGTAAHRYHPYVGAIVAVALVLSTAVFARSWKGFGGLAAFATAWIALALALAYVDGPGGSVVFVDDAVGKAWLFGAAAAIIAVAVTPPTVFDGGGRVANQT